MKTSAQKYSETFEMSGPVAAFETVAPVTESKPLRFLTRSTPSLLIQAANEGESPRAYSLPGHPGIGGDVYKLDIGADCNRLLMLVERIESGAQSAAGGSMASTDTQDANALRDIVERVVAFEELEAQP